MSRCCNSAVSMKNPNTFLPTSFTIDFPFHISKIMVVSILELGSFFQVKRKNRQKRGKSSFGHIAFYFGKDYLFKDFLCIILPKHMSPGWPLVQTSREQFIFSLLALMT